MVSPVTITRATRIATVFAAIPLTMMLSPGAASAAPSGTITQQGNAVILTLTGESGYTDGCEVGVWATNDSGTDPVSRGLLTGGHDATVALNVPAGNYFAGWGCGGGPLTLNPITVTGALAPGAAPVGGSFTQSGNAVTMHTQSDGTHAALCEFGVSTSNTNAAADMVRAGAGIAAPVVGSVDVTWTLPNGNYYVLYGCLDRVTGDIVGQSAMPPNAVPITVPGSAGGSSQLSSEVASIFGS